ncbi:MAG: PorP/SprF family type IX secretion system membrane protein [Flavobacteriia bacterium]|jgi:hypothetical protein
MRKLSLLILGIWFTLSVYAQQAPNWAWHSMNWAGINPSHHGLNQYVEASLGFRRQWVGFSGAPTVLNATLSIPFNERKSDAAMFGVGLNTNIEKNGPFTFSSASLEGAINLKTNKENRLSVGMGMGFTQVGYDPNWVETNQPDVIISKFSTNAYPLLKLGMSFRTKKALYGLYATDLTPSKWKEVGVSSALRTEWGAYFRYLVQLREDWFLLPAIKVSEVFKTPLNYEVMLRLNYNYRFQVWMGTLNLNAVQLGIGCRIKEIFSVNYMFEKTRSGSKSVFLNSHSVGVKCILNNHGAILKKQQLLLD